MCIFTLIIAAYSYWWLIYINNIICIQQPCSVGKTLTHRNSNYYVVFIECFQVVNGLDVGNN